MNSEETKEVEIEIRHRGRRAFLRRAMSVTAIAAVTAVAGCHAVTVNGVTTIVIDVDTIEKYAKAGVNGVSLILSITPFASAIGVTAVTLIEGAGAALTSSLTAFSNATGGQLTVSYDDTSWKTRVNSILSDIETVSSSVGTAFNSVSSSLSATVASEVNTYIHSIEVIASAADALVSTISARRAASPADVQKALTVLRVS